MTDRMHWNRAQLAQERPLKKEQKLYPHTVGERPENWGDGYLRVCKQCGYHECSPNCPTMFKREYMGVPSGRHNVADPNVSRAASIRAMEQLRKNDVVRVQLEEMRERYESATRKGASITAETYRRRIHDAERMIKRVDPSCCDDCERARREMVTHCICGRPTGC